MREIGGYFELESRNQNIDLLLPRGYYVNTGRNALEFILRSLDRVSRVWIPYFTCDVILEPLKKLNIPFNFYHIDDNLDIVDDFELGDNDYILYTNYFGIKDTYLASIQQIYGDKLIIDNAQALFCQQPNQINAIYSPRKFVGLADGGIAVTTNKVDVSALNIDESYQRFSHLIKRVDLGANAAYSDFQKNDNSLIGQPIKLMSKLTQRMFLNLDFHAIIAKRLSNFKELHTRLKLTNKLPIDDFGDYACPMVYPYLTDDLTLRTRLIRSKIYVATYWPNVFEWCSENDVEYKLAKNIIPLPIDQRYGSAEMKYIVSAVLDRGL